MKLLVKDDMVVGTAVDTYSGPMEFIQAPEDFDVDKLDSYRIVDGELVIPTVVPDSVTKRQGRQQMTLMGIIDQVQTAIDAIPDPIQKALVQSFWDDSSEYERNHPQMVQLAQAIGLTEDQLDDAFIAAAKL